MACEGGGCEETQDSDFSEINSKGELTWVQPGSSLPASPQSTEQPERALSPTSTGHARKLSPGFTLQQNIKEPLRI